MCFQPSKILRMELCIESTERRFLDRAHRIGKAQDSEVTGGWDRFMDYIRCQFAVLRTSD